ncbi:Hpt domain-containing protein [Pseudomonas sp. Marseille-QA0892]
MADLPHLDDDVMATLADVMEDEYPVLLETFLTDSEERIRMLLDAAGDLEALRRAAHSFKGSSSNMGAALLADLCRQLETASRQGDADATAPLIEQIQREYAVVKILTKTALQRHRF